MNPGLTSTDSHPSEDDAMTPDRFPLKRAFALCTLKTRSNIRLLADQPKAAPWAEDGNYFARADGFNELGNWTSSFFTGMALLAWQETEDEYFLQQTLRLAPAYREKALNPEFHSHHDMGFLYSLYSVALCKLTGDRRHRDVGLKAAEALAMRFNSNGNFIRAWGKLGTDDNENMAIIDCLMNLPLLFWASQESGDEKFAQIASLSADTSLKYFIRPDDSVYHCFRFNLKTGAPLGGDNHCGRDVDSHWARGTGWAVYGFAIAYRYTKKEKYLEAALRLARKFNEELNGDNVPVWDFRLPAGEPALRDTSAAAIIACGYQELEKLGAADPLISKTKATLLKNLCADKFLNFDQKCAGVLRDAQANVNGRGTAGNVYASWGDYYLMEALSRELTNMNTFW